MSVVNALEVKISEAAYQRQISTIEGYVSDLNGLKGQYEQKEREVSNFYTGQDADDLRASIKEYIVKIQESIDACNGSIEQLKNVISENTNVAGDIKSIISDSVEIAKNLWL